MTDISVIILIGQEKIHLKRCIERLAPLDPKCIWLIESQPDDGGVAIAKETAAEYGLTLKTVYNKWPGLHAKQFNWALDYVCEPQVPSGRSDLARSDVPTSVSLREPSARSASCQGLSQWILRLDADENLTEETSARLKEELPKLSEDVAGLTLELKRRFCGREIRHATNGIRLLRIWRAVAEQLVAAYQQVLATPG